MYMELIEKASNLAADRYRNGDFLCSEAIVYTINELLDEPLPKEIVRLASGLPVGIGGSGCSCGAVTGGVMALGLALGRTEPRGKCPDVLPASKELHDWFKENNNSVCCRVLIKDFKFGSQDHLDQCIKFTGEVAGKTMELIIKYQNETKLKKISRKLGLSK